MMVNFKLQSLPVPVRLTHCVPSNIPRKYRVKVAIDRNTTLTYHPYGHRLHPIKSIKNQLNDCNEQSYSAQRLSIFTSKEFPKKWKKMVSRVKKEKAVAITENRKIKYILMSVDYYNLLTQAEDRNSL